jgi:hypothetical protein
MKIYLDQGEIGDLRLVVRRRGKFLTVLHVINLSHRHGKLEISLLYQPLLHWRHHTGQVVIVIGFTLPLLLIVVQARRPFVHVEVLKEEEE